MSGDRLSGDDIQAAARLAGVRPAERERSAIAQVLGGFLAAVRGLPAGQTIEPLPTFVPGEEDPHER